MRPSIRCDGSAPVIAYYADTLAETKASIRLRLLAPMTRLRDGGWRFEPADCIRLNSYNALWFSKSFSRRAVAIGRAAERAGVPILVDVCDNILDHARRRFDLPKLARVREQLDRAAIVAVSTAVLAGQLQEEMPSLAGKLRIVPDMMECMAPRTPNAADARELAQMQAFLARHPNALHCVWFGKSSGFAAGLAHLDRAVAQLARFAQTHPVTLTVISNTRLGHRMASRRWPVPHHYLPWSIGSIGAALAAHRVAVLPVKCNAYTLGKTINRPATAMLAGLGVVADALPAYEELRPFVWLDDWQGGLAAYARDWDAETARIAAGQAHLKAHHSPESIVAMWRAALIDTIGASATAGLKVDL